MRSVVYQARCKSRGRKLDKNNRIVLVESSFSAQYGNCHVTGRFVLSVRRSCVANAYLCSVRVCIVRCTVCDRRVLCAEYRSCDGCDPGCLPDEGSGLFSAPEAGYHFQKTGRALYFSLCLCSPQMLTIPARVCETRHVNCTLFSLS